MIIGQTVRDPVTGNWCGIVEIDAAGGRVRLKNPYVEIGWRPISEVEEYKPGMNQAAGKPTQAPVDQATSAHESIAGNLTNEHTSPTQETAMRIFRVTSTIKPEGRLIKAPTAKIAEKYVIGLMGVKATLATQDELIQAGQNGETAELANAPEPTVIMPSGLEIKGGTK